MSQPIPGQPINNQPVAAPPGTDFPGKTLGIVGLILAIFFNLIGMIVSIIANKQSKDAGYKNGPAKAGIIVGAVLLALSVIVTIIIVVVGIGAAGALLEQCAGLEPGVYTDGNTTITCN